MEGIGDEGGEVEGVDGEGGESCEEGEEEPVRRRGRRPIYNGGTRSRNTGHRGRCIRKCKKRDVLRGKGGRGWTRVEGARLMKGHIPGNTHPVTDRIPTPIALMLITISKKDTLNRLSGQFGAFTRGKQNIADTTEQAER